ncbi:hypothetical protein [Tichowtungia aerotolerans]|uniref:STAS/SEC14 domain-containing protein n=1 Tax=Tichowtungia aerotolerans TaxID=2697043 RepID=A0A6P1M0U8_9BACT|nr:hypothetical protein [Tichowtungia aerotolerans]QHI68180.1 hypothetical protein GT409_01515 [Tichowtungia aerotolerans]
MQPLETFISQTPKYLFCTTSGDFTLPEGIKTIDTVLSAVLQTKTAHVLMDVSQISNPCDETEKIMWAYEVQREMNLFEATHGFLPRVALYGSLPFITEDKATSDYFRSVNIPIQTFDSKEEAKSWLLEAA